MELLYVSVLSFRVSTQKPLSAKNATEIGWHVAIESPGSLYQRESDLTKKL